MSQENFKIDIENILLEKSKKKKKPSCLLVFILKRLIHQNSINYILEKTKGLGGYKFFKEAIVFFNFKIKIKGEENLDKTKKYIFASNHPLGGADGICLGGTIGDLYQGNFKYILNDLLLNLPNLKDIGIPVNKIGRLSRETHQKMVEAFESDAQIITFPAGLCSRLQKDGEIKDLQWKKHVIQSATTYHRDIVPVYFSGKNSWLFYHIAKWREKLGIRMNYEMILLPDEFFKAKGKVFTIHFGKPISWETFTDTSKTPLQWAEQLKQTVYKIKTK